MCIRSLLGSSALSRCAGLACVLCSLVFIDCWEWESTTAGREKTAAAFACLDPPVPQQSFNTYWLICDTVSRRITFQSVAAGQWECLRECSICDCSPLKSVNQINIHGPK